MAIEQRNLHLRLQEFCDCYVQTDFMKEIEGISKGLGSEDKEEQALKFLGLVIMYGVTESARKISLTRTKEGQVHLDVEATGTYKLPAPPLDLADEAFRVMRSITYLEGPKGSEPLSVGLKNDRLEIKVGFDTVGDKTALSFSYPGT